VAAQINTIRRTVMERILENGSRRTLLAVLKNAHIHDIIEVSRQEDIPKLYEALRFLPDDPGVSFMIPILIIRD
jgi:hypothetical protein